ncbi:MAG: oligosaccharide flippase family protein [Anaerolineae bacterium]|nr:oligosaccharide flippase family protein [Anaerolineae bacterium]
MQHRSAALWVGLTGRFPFLVRLLKHASWLYLANMFGQVIGLFLTLVVVKYFSVSAYGHIGLVVAYCEALNRLIDFRVWEAVINYVGAYVERHQWNHAFSVLKLCYAVDLGSGLVAFAVMVLSAGIAARWLIKAPETAGLIRLYSVALLFRTTDGTSSALLRVYDRYRWLGVKRVINAVFKAALVLGFLSFRISLESIFLAYVFTDLAVAAFVNAAAWRVIRVQFAGVIREPRAGDGIPLREIVTFMINTNVLGTLQQLTAKSDVLLVGYFASAEAAGLFRLAANLANMLVRLAIPLQTVVYPDVVKAHTAGDRQKLRQLARSSSMIAAVVLLPVSLGMAVLFVPLLKLIAVRPEYLSAAPYMRVMLAGVCVDFLFLWLPFLLTANNRVTFLNAAQVVRLLFWIAGAAVLIPFLGGIGGACLFTLSRVVWVGLLGVYVWRRHLL